MLMLSEGTGTGLDLRPVGVRTRPIGPVVPGCKQTHMIGISHTHEFVPPTQWTNTYSVVHQHDPTFVI